MSGWADDPELVATFRQEVDDRLASLCEGLLAIDGHSNPRQLVGGLFRDAHTVKGSARMLGLDAVVGVAHKAEDLLGAIRDGRMTVRSDLVDLLLAAADGIGRSMPGAEHPVTSDDLDAIAAALEGALAGDDPVTVPKFTVVEEEPAVDADIVDTATARARTGESVRVPARRVHDLMDTVGEAELEGRRVERRTFEVANLASEQINAVRALRAAAVQGELPADVASAVHALVALGDQMQAASRELRARVEDAQNRLVAVREGAMSLAMVPVRRVVAAFPKLVREVGTATGKDVRLVLDGEDVELDTRVLEGVADALRHLVTNAVDHGCESTETRIAAGKDPVATVTVGARAAGSTVVIEVSDDGGGIDEESLRETAIERGLLTADNLLSGSGLLSVLFMPGFSTRDDVTETSGRGVGLDVVRTAVEDLGGTVEIETELGQGTKFVITLPVTLGVMRCLVARVGDERYAVPVTGVVETVSLADATTQTVAGAPVLVRHGGTLPLADLGTALGVSGERNARTAVVVRYGGTTEALAWAVDALEGELELVVKDLGGFLGRIPGISGATIDGDGDVMLLIDVREMALAQLSANTVSALPVTMAPRAGSAAPVRAADAKPRVLVVEDSVGVRELQRVILEGAGYEVATAVDGLDGAGRLGPDPVDLVLSDVEMPGMDGFTLTRTIRRTRGWEDVPVIIMTSRGDEADKRAGLDAGASAYLLKSDFDQNELIETVQRLIGR
jgi:chemotaxis protein histidine kinase CheA